MKGGIKKEYRILADKPILCWSILPFIQLALFDSIIIAVPPGQINQVQALLTDFIDLSKVQFVEGGKTRQESVYFALLALEQKKPAYVLIHDGARPWVTKEIILDVLAGTKKQGACIPVIKARDAMKELDQAQLIRRHLDRETTVCAQTPQGFSFSQILAAHKKAAPLAKLFIDDSEVYAQFIGPVLTVAGSTENRKITYEYDLYKEEN
jgi:2-C-methyl-D-erythritol 4-phosphate cytidylyltransferase